MNKPWSFRVVSFALALVAVLTLTGCGGGKEKTSRDPKLPEKTVEEMAGTGNETAEEMSEAGTETAVE